MSASIDINNVDITKLLRTWDSGSKAARAQILQSFISKNTGKTGPELDVQFSNAASLFLTRLTAWLRLSYMDGPHLGLQLQAIRIFVGSTSGHHFLTEFLEVGGILTTLEIIGLNDAKEGAKTEALHLLSTIANAGRRYKELICESYGIRAVAECLAKSQSVETQSIARNLIQELAVGNPRYEGQIYKALIALLSSSSPKAQQLATLTLRYVQSLSTTATTTIVEPTLSLLRSLHVEVQYEACELLKDLMKYDVQQYILEGLVALLKPSMADLTDKREAQEDLKLPEMQDGGIAAFVQQAAAAKMIGVLARQSPEIAEACVQLGAIHGLLFALGNDKYAYAQKQAYTTLEFFVRSFPIVSDAVKEAMGEQFFDTFLNESDNLCFSMTSIQIDVLKNNRVNLAGLE